MFILIYAAQPLIRCLMAIFTIYGVLTTSTRIAYIARASRHRLPNSIQKMESEISTVRSGKRLEFPML